MIGKKNGLMIKSINKDQFIRPLIIC